MFRGFRGFGAEVFDEAGNDHGRFVGLVIYQPEGFFINIILVQCYVKMTLHLCRRGHCNKEKLNKPYSCINNAA